MYGIPLSAAEPDAKTWGFQQVTAGAFSTTNPAGAKGARIILVGDGSATADRARAGASCAKYVAINPGEVHTFSGTIAANLNPNTLVTSADPSVSLSAPTDGTATGGDVNFSSQVPELLATNLSVAIPILTFGSAGSAYASDIAGTFYTKAYLGGVQIIWDY